MGGQLVLLYNLAGTTAEMVVAGCHTHADKFKIRRCSQPVQKAGLYSGNVTGWMGHDLLPTGCMRSKLSSGLRLQIA